MLLFIDSDQDKSTGWKGYDYAVNTGRVHKNLISLARWPGEKWEKIRRIDMAFQGNEMELKVPLDVIGSTCFDFHWADNPQHLKDVSAFFLDGDSALTGGLTTGTRDRSSFTFTQVVLK